MVGATELIERVLDPGSWRSWDGPLVEVATNPDYASALARARNRTGLDEAVLTGTGAIGGRAVAVIASEFDFMAGSIGVAAAERMVAAIERATRERLPLVASPASGGTRLQEGTVAFVQMVKITAALVSHRRAGLPYLVYLRDPTTGGVLASWAALGHVTAAEPGALIGFLGPRVHQALYGHALPAEVQSAENLYAHGLIDAVVPPEDLRDVAIRALAVLAQPPLGPMATEEPTADAPPVAGPRIARTTTGSAWEAVVRTRRTERPGVRTLLKLAAADVTPLNGTGEGEQDPALILALARFGQARCVLLGHDRRRLQPRSGLGPGGLREAMRGMRLAADLHLPLVSVIDTPGVVPTRDSEEGGFAGGIARSLAELIALPQPTVCVLLGEGGGGAALALLPADRVLCAQHAWLSPLPPEGAAEILYRTTERAPEAAAELRIDASSLLEDAIVDHIVPERPDAADEPEAFARRLGQALEAELVALIDADADQRLAARHARYRHIGTRPTPDGP